MMDGADQITAVVLAGGMGRRMEGIDKGLALLSGREMVAYVIDTLQPNVSEIIVNANRNLDAYSKFGARVVGDSLEGYQGPLAGVEAGMAESKTAWIYTCPCDSPMQSVELLPTMWKQLSATDASIGLAYDGERTHPVFSLLNTSLLPSLRQYLNDGQRKIDRWFAQHNMRELDCSEHAASFVNINTEEDRQRAEQVLQHSLKTLRD